LQHLIHGFPLSGPESGHTERRAARNAAVATVLFHPDFNRRLRNHTESADPSSEEKKALAGLGCFTFTAGGDFHPALRTSATRIERPCRNYGEWTARQQAPSPWGIRMSPCAQSEPGGGIGPSEINGWTRQTGTPWANPTRRTRTTRIRFRFVLTAKVNARDQLWTSAALPVDGFGVQLRGFRKSHHLIPASPGRPKDWATQGLQSLVTPHVRACRFAACV
jgi:hypothetical protein